MPHAVGSSPLPPIDTDAPATILCFSHLRWDFVTQRPQHLMRRFAGHARVLFWEEPVYMEGLAAPMLRTTRCPESGVEVLCPLLREEDGRTGDRAVLVALLNEAAAEIIQPLVRWYYTPMMFPFSSHLPAACVVYDCMDELANFRHAPAEMATREAALLAAADLVFAGGRSLCEAKRRRHSSVHLFPSSVDSGHFAQARLPGDDPVDQRALPRPRLGFYGVIDERLDLELVAALADARPGWSIVMVGPVVKIDPATLPTRTNIEFVGHRAYAELPDYLRGWDVALMPFALNAATRHISPTKTPEYLAAGRPVVSTAIDDVVRDYGDCPGVTIARDVDGFVSGCEAALARAANPGQWLPAVDRMLASTSWDVTQAAMQRLIAAVIASRHPAARPRSGAAGGRARHYDVMVVGAGFAGSVMAERLANGSGKRVLVIDKRPHIAGNAYDCRDAAGLLIHRYGPHIFHTNSSEIFAYLSRFTQWRPYEHRVLASAAGQLVPMPINRTTLNLLYGLSLASEAEAAAFLAGRAEPVDPVRTSADVVISAIGRELYETFFQGYTRKQWGMDPSELDKSVTARVPTRTDDDDRYFTDRHQAMPAEGYTRMFEQMLDHPAIDVLLGTEFAQAKRDFTFDHLVFTGPIDEYFGFRFGQLPYRSLRFVHETIDRQWYQPVATVNYPDEAVHYTRITEFKHLTGEQNARTSIVREFPSAEGDPYYPIPREDNQRLFKRYEALALATENVTFVGRLATYRYYNMDQVVGQALAAYRRLAPMLRDTGSANVSKESASVAA